MTFRFAKQTLSGAIAMAIAVSAGATVSSAQGNPSAYGDGPFIVASKIVSDTVADPGTHVGDVGNSVVANNYDAMTSGSYDVSMNGTGCANGNCGGSDGTFGGGCQNGQCGANGCQNGQCGANGCKGGGGIKGMLAGLPSGGLHQAMGEKCGYAGDLMGCHPRKYDHSDLFYNYYSQGNCNQTNAQMYISPGPVPPFVGHTFYTYQPFHPHEFMYWHKNRFHNSYDNGRGLNRTKAKYYAPPIKTALSNLYWNKIRLPR